MTPKDKAKELIDKFKPHAAYPCDCDADYDMSALMEKERVESAKQCALIAVDEILNDYAIFNKKHKSFKVPLFWETVKKEIKNL